MLLKDIGQAQKQRKDIMADRQHVQRQKARGWDEFKEFRFLCYLFPWKGLHFLQLSLVVMLLPVWTCALQFPPLDHRPRQAWLCSASLVTSTKKTLLSVEWWLQKCGLVEVGIQSSLWWSQVCCSDLFSRENLLQGAQWINSSQLCGSLGSASTCKLTPHSPQAVSAND